MIALAIAGLSILPSLAAAQSVTTSSSTLVLQKIPSDYWQNAVARFRSMETTVPKHGTVLLGDSITNRWPAGMFPGENVVNRGIGSDHIGGWKYYGVLDRLDTSVKVIEPKRIFLLIGVNDMLENGPPMDNMIASYGHLLDQLKINAPGAEIYAQSILPVSKPDFSYMHDPIIELNSHIKQLAAEKGVHYVDLYSRFKNEKGELKAELTKDGVHLTQAGYDLWLDVLKDEGILKTDDNATSKSTSNL